ncbi:SDR family NAD(P)-dependent oxidoreductase (plasmid) [Rhizobium leguminosarum]|uniref:SDR family oxidoreductase n=1 Tax=Rhizobium leguminosarum TaxID=384 RepID=A0A444IKZ1_RHILE|nr:SDR family NAD(P)-dependent oxidoreductase [Rhizobium leguminosarum]ASS58184.1 NAD(P)-dependent oxidoreductase [Rhizobium leguminosarum bv. viciae]MBB4330125.1 3-oxoacyl-[acyl-carrier protein] reductase [Rhizobium leguminosarum]MBB4340061.1 3-oxoacyl-[acyl-carrier protein] reductase [Rhizobium leguminosarum]MBB4355520.1 3-oxoacyl-[acyl-carrier protein] reductase [Rhizobium leguminosarum]MBB4389533.1 3-oxoacyl-[acyl-carrier protein] reductase [Rhizobium leguminosarum]
MPVPSAIVTGAGSGIGRAIAIRLSQDGYAILVNDLHLDRAQAVADEIAAAGGKAVAVAGDVSSETDTAKVYEVAVSAFGHPQLLVNCAGIVHQALFENLEVADFDRMFAIHVRGTFLMTKLALPSMLAAGDGVIVNVASQLGQIGGIELVHYAGAKAAIIGMTKSLAREVSNRGVRVNAVAPGPINTPLVRELSQEWRVRKAAELPLGRFGEPEEVAATVSFLASPAASLFVGQTLGPNSGDVML